MVLNEIDIVKSLNAKESIHRIVGIYVQEVLYSTSLGCLITFRNFVALQPIAATFLRKEEHRLVHRGRIDVLRKVFISRVGPFTTHSATRLLMKLGQRSTLDVAQMANGDNHRVVRIEVFGIKLVLVGDDFSASYVTKLLLNFL